MIQKYLQKTLKIFFTNNIYKLKSLNSNLIDKFWKEEIKSKNSFYALPKHSTGDNYKSKIGKILSYRKKRADYQFITASENNAWLLI